MKAIELLKVSHSLIKALKNANLGLDDTKYIGLFDEYTEGQSCGLKTSYLVASLANKYHISERKVYNLLKKFKNDCKIPAS